MWWAVEMSGDYYSEGCVEGYADQHLEEYCTELCYHEHLCELDPDCVDYDCYCECMRRP